MCIKNDSFSLCWEDGPFEGDNWQVVAAPELGFLGCKHTILEVMDSNPALTKIFYVFIDKFIRQNVFYIEESS